MGECRPVGDVFSNGLGLQKTGFLKILPQNAWIMALIRPTPMAKSKTPPRPLREALRIRKRRSGWESGYLLDGLDLNAVRKGGWRSKIGVGGALLASVSKGRGMGFE